MPLPVALSLVDVTVRGRVALDRVSLDVRRGEIVGLLGPNGSGKSSTLAVAAGVLDPAAGAVLVEGGAPTPPRSRRASDWCRRSQPSTTNCPRSTTSRYAPGGSRD